MLDFENAPKKATNLSLNAKVLDAARAMDLNISQTVDRLLADEVRRRYWELWNADNQAAIAAYNRRVEHTGLALAKYRSWSKSSGDGRAGS